MDPTISLRRTLPLALTWNVQKNQYNVMFKSFLSRHSTHYLPMVWCKQQGSLHCDEHLLSNTVNLKQGVPTRRLTDSMTSRKTSFFLYLMPSDLQDTALVTVAGGLGAPVSSLWPSWVMYLRERQKETQTLRWTTVTRGSRLSVLASSQKAARNKTVSRQMREDCLMAVLWKLGELQRWLMTMSASATALGIWLYMQQQWLNMQQQNWQSAKSDVSC